VDTLLVAIRIASYGHDMDFNSQCPACNHESERTLDLRTVLDSIKTPDYTKNLAWSDIEIYFKPLSYKNLNDNNQMQFENQKLLQMLPDSAVSDSEKMTALSAALRKITDITVSSLARSIAAIKTPQALVSEPGFIDEFLKNCDRALFNQIRDRIVELKVQSEMQPLKLACTECNHEYEQSITLDMSSFFESAS
jgi:transcription elongation factor Elf1